MTATGVPFETHSWLPIAALVVLIAGWLLVGFFVWDGEALRAISTLIVVTCLSLALAMYWSDVRPAAMKDVLIEAATTGTWSGGAPDLDISTPGLICATPDGQALMLLPWSEDTPVQVAVDVEGAGSVTLVTVVDVSRCQG